MSKRLLIAVFPVLLSAYVPVQNTLWQYGYNLIIDNTRCAGTYRTLVVYINNQLLGQVVGTRVFNVPTGSQDFKASPLVGNSPAIFKTLRMEKDEIWKVCE